MFGGSNEKNKKKAVNIPEGALNSIVAGTEVRGDIESKSDIRIDGTLIGSLNCSGKVIIGKTGNLEGDIKCQDAVVQGSFEGTLAVENSLDVKASARINGEINTEKLIVESGAIFNVHCQMGNKSFGTLPSEKQKVKKSLKSEKETA